MIKLKKNGFMAKKYKSLLIASLLGWLVSLIGSLSDSVLAGILISEDAVGAIELVAPLFNILMFFASLLAVGISTLFSIYQGAFDEEKAARVNGMGIVVAIASGLFFTILMFVFKNAYFSFYGSSGSINVLGREYYSCFYLLAFSYPIYWLLYYLVSSDGDDKNVLLCDIITAISNPIFSLFLASKFGIRGLGYGTVISNMVTVIFLAAHFTKKNNSIKFRLCFSMSEFTKVCAIGSSISLTQIYLAVVDIVMNKLIIMRFGSEYLAAYAVVNLVLNFGGCFSCSIDAASPFITVAYGEKNYVTQRSIVQFSMKYAAMLGVAFTITEFLLASVLPQLFGISNPEIYATAVYAGKVLAFLNLGLTFECALSSYYPKIDQTLLGNLYSVTYSLIAPIVLVLLLSNIGGFYGMVWGFFLSPYVTLLLGYIFVCIKYGKKMYPFMIKETEDKIYVYELDITEEEIIALNKVVKENLENCNIDETIINQVQLMLEETLMIVKDKNAQSKKTISADCSLIVNNENVRLITRDNGIIFDITDVNSKINSLREYVTSRLIETNSNAKYLTTISFNRNSFIWER